LAVKDESNKIIYGNPEFVFFFFKNSERSVIQ